MQIFNGNQEAAKIDNKIQNLILGKEDILQNYELAIIQVGDNSESNKYIELKKQYGLKFGIQVIHEKISAELNDLEIENIVSQIVKREQVLGVIVQLPLPRQSLYKILDLIPLKKDVDMLSSDSQSKFYNGSLELLSPVVKSTEYFINSIDINFENKKAAVIGNGKLVGKPVAFFLKSIGFNVEIFENYASGNKIIADLIVLGSGVPNLVNGNDLSASSNVLDFGSSIIDGKIVGDLDRNSKIDHLGTVALSPGGVGPLVVRFLFLNFLSVCLDR